MKDEKITRRTFVNALASGTAISVPAMASYAEEESPADAQSMSPDREVRLEYLKPHEIDAVIQENPILYQPLGTIEWHGLQNIVGVDAVKAHELCIRAARQSGGVVAPALYGGVGGIDQPYTFVMEAEDDIHSVLLRSWLERLCREAVRNGFKAVIVLTGHYGAAQQIVVRDCAVRMSKALGVPVLGTPEYFLALDEDYTGDHAAWGETSLMMYLKPESVDLSLLGDAPHRGVHGRDPKLYATQQDGERLTHAIVKRLAALAKQMAAWDRDTIRQFVAAEEALVNRQMELAVEQKVIWGGWRNISKGVFAGYADCLVERKFEEILKRIQEL